MFKICEPGAMIVGVPIAPSPAWDKGNGPETRPGVEPSGRGDVTPNLPALAGTPALQGGEEVREVARRTATYLPHQSRTGPRSTWATVGRAFVENWRTPWRTPEVDREAR